MASKAPVAEIVATAKGQLAQFKRVVERGPRAMLRVDSYGYLALPRDGSDWRIGL